MIHFLATHRHSDVVGKFFDDWGRSMRDRISISSYEWLPTSRSMPPGAEFGGGHFVKAGTARHYGDTDS